MCMHTVRMHVHARTGVACACTLRMHVHAHTEDAMCMHTEDACAYTQ